MKETTIPEHHFDLQAHETEGAFMISVTGHIDSLNAEEFQARLKQNVKDYGGNVVILDLATLTYISSAGLRAILFTAKMLHASGRKFSICSLSEAVNSMVRIAGFDKIIDVYESPAEAVSAVTG